LAIILINPSAVRTILISLIILLGVFHISGCNETITLTLDEKYPRWLKDGEYHTKQTSGICFVRGTNNGEKDFLLADDIGDIHRLTIENDTIFRLKKIAFAQEVIEYLKDFPKKDFEELVFDKYTGKVYISIEGNGKNYLNYVGIYELGFYNNDIFTDSIISIRKVEIKPSETILKHVKLNIGYEGMAADENYIYLGLEGFSSKDNFADSTLLIIVEKQDLEVKKVINTFELGIGTICGLYSDKNNSLWGIDRNRMTIFHLFLDNKLNIIGKRYFDFVPAIPGNKSLPYIAALESITVDNSDNLYLVDDPYTKVFIPPQAIYDRLDEKTKNNFKNYTPVIYKYNISY